MFNILLSILGTFGFCSILNVPKNKIIWIIIGSFISAAAYEILNVLLEFSVFISTMIAAFCIGIFSEIIARTVKTPATVILLPSTIPLLPGGSLYYAMSYLVHSDYKMFVHYAFQTINTGFGIAIGAVLTAIVIKLIYALTD